MFQCPITLKPLQGLCLWGSDGFIYDYSTLPYFERQKWHSPITLEKMAGLYGADIMLYAAGTCIIRSREEDIRVLIRNNTTDGDEDDPDEDILINYIPAHEQRGYDEEGYDLEGYNRAGYNREGYDVGGYDRAGYDRTEYDRAGFDRAGYDREGYDVGGYDRAGYDRTEYDRAGFDRAGYNREGYDVGGYDRAGYDVEGYNRGGFDRTGFRRDGYDIDGYDKHGRSRDGYDKKGYNRDGFNGDGFNRGGFRRDGYNIYGRDKYGKSRDTNFQNGLVRAAEFDLNKITNAMLYTRYMWASCPIFRDKYGGEGNQDRRDRIQSKFDKLIATKKTGSDFDRGLAEGMALWTIIRNDADMRKEITGEFKKWRSTWCAGTC